jgi:predicted dehydrogenase
MTACDTWDNAALHTWVEPSGGTAFPMRLEMKRLAPGATNTWWIEVLGTDGGVRFSTARPKTVETFSRRDGQAWCRRDLGFGAQVAAVTGGIFEFGFPDAIQQMWAAYLLERSGCLKNRFGCVTPAEALASHHVFAAALAAHGSQSVEAVSTTRQ